jgi:AbrB family looped-hinge helix DNA binding protein
MDDTTTTTIDSAGRIVIPKGIREKAGLYAGARVTIQFDDEGIHLSPVGTPLQLVKRGRLLVVVSADESPAVNDATVAALREEIAAERSEGLSADPAC